MPLHAAQLRPAPRRLAAAAALLGALLLAGPARAQQAGDVMALVRADRWADAEAAVAGEADPVARKLVTYFRLLAPAAANAGEIDAFMAANPDWPNQAGLARRREEALAVEPDDTTARALCARIAPRSAGALSRCADAEAAASETAAAAASAGAAWIAGITEPTLESAFLQRWGSVLTPEDQWQRLLRLSGAGGGALVRQTQRLDPPHRLAAEALLALRRDDARADALYAALPATLAADPAMLLEEARHLRRQGSDAAAAALWRSSGAAAQASASTAQLAALWAEREQLARALLHDGDAGALPHDPTASALPHDPNAGALPHDPTASALPHDPNAGALPRDPNAGALPRDPNAGALPHDPDTGALSHDPDTGTLSHDPTGALSHDPDTGALSHDPDTGTLSHDPDTGALSHDPDTGTLSHDSDVAAYGVADGYRDGVQTAFGGEVVVDAEFLAGWIALRRLHDTAAAHRHFARLAAVSPAAITQGRAHYWLARTDAAAGDEAAARREYASAARWPTTFYGQLAALAEPGGAAALAQRLATLRDPGWTAEQALDFAGREVARAAALLVAWGDAPRARPFLLRLVELAPDPADCALAARLATGLGMPDQAVMIARRAGLAGLVLPQSGWPVPVDAPEGKVAPALTLGLIRQESSFDRQATSVSGARGLMQLMPATARDVARQAGGGDAAALAGDAGENMRLGTIYLRGLIDQFDSLPLAIAAYNAGPARVGQWLTLNGDPRQGDLQSGPSNDMIDWIELIPFAETRNYVQRVIENVVIYRARLGDHTPHPLTRWLG
jgi:soluble lytic murein transglycosylase-like protein